MLIRGRRARGNWGEIETKLREWDETIMETRARGNWGETKSKLREWDGGGKGEGK